MNNPVVRVSRRGASRLDDGHLWVFAGDVEDAGTAEAGDAVRVVDARHRSLGMAHYSAASQITLRKLTSQTRPIDRDYFEQRIERAVAHRERVVADTEAYRLISSEGDLLPALIVDRYAEVLVVQALDQGMDRALPLILEILQAKLAPRAIVVRNDAAIREKENLRREVRIVHGALTAPVTFRMAGLEWRADLLGGQKTGTFLDQRENHVAAARYARGRALDCFTHTGGFALHLARVCEKVEAIDASAAALASARVSAEANGLSNIDFRQGDVFEMLKGMASSRRHFDTIVLDPPAFTKSRGGKEGALRGYADIQQRALRMLTVGGILVTCSCSQHVGEHDLMNTVAEAAALSKRTVRVLERRQQAADHPVLLSVPETHYLKCLILEVLE